MAGRGRGPGTAHTRAALWRPEGDGMSPQGLATTRCAVVSGGHQEDEWTVCGRLWRGAGGPCGRPERWPQAPHADGLGRWSLPPQATQHGNRGPAGCCCVTSQAGGRGSEQPGGVEGLLPLLGPPSPISLSWPRAWQLLSAFSISSCEAVDGRRGGGAAQREWRAMSWARPGPPWSVTRGRGCLGLGPAQRAQSAARQQLLGPGWTHGDSPSLWGD